jgi:DNA repair protein SbcD/Mre11
MRIVHFADNHLGAGTDQRAQDVIDSFRQAVDKIIDVRPDLVINAGDLFHMVHPSNWVIAFASEQLIRLARDAGIPTFIITGNHDAPKQAQMGAALAIFKDYENIHVVYKSRYEKVRIGEVSISAVPHCIDTMTMKQEMARIECDPTARYNILVLHGVVGGIKEFQMADLSEQEIPTSCFEKGFDYVALGHYHKYTRIREMVYYSGSTERLSMSEKDSSKGFIEIDFSKSAESDKIRFHELITRPMIDLPTVTAAGKSAEQIMSEIEATVKAQNPEDKIIRVSVADIPEETYRALPFDKLTELKKEAFSLDIRFEKASQPEDNLYADLNLNRLDSAFEKFLETRNVESLDKERIKELSLTYLHRAETDES